MTRLSRIPQTPAVVAKSVAAASPMTNAIWAHYSELEGNPFQYRPEIDPATPENQEMLQSIIKHGILQPLPARLSVGKSYKGIKYETMAGHRRTALSELAAQESPERAWIPLILGEYSDEQAAEIAIAENEQRENPSDWATAIAIKKLMEMYATKGEPLSESAVARKLNKSIGYVRNHLGMLKLRPSLQEVAQKHSKVKSSLFEIEKINDPEVERELIEQVESGAPFTQIKSRVEQHQAHEKWLKDSQRPDRETSAHAAAVAKTGGISTSRGRIATGNTPAEAFQNCTVALTQMGDKLDTFEHWEKLLTESHRAKLQAQLHGLAMRLAEKI